MYQSTGGKDDDDYIDYTSYEKNMYEDEEQVEDDSGMQEANGYPQFRLCASRWIFRIEIVVGSFSSRPKLPLVDGGIAHGRRKARRAFSFRER